jgi:tetrapyrrole methylase family protein/MazG family protein
MTIVNTLDGIDYQVDLRNLPDPIRNEIQEIVITNGNQLEGLASFPYSPANPILILNPSAAGAIEFLVTLLGGTYSATTSLYYSSDGNKWNSVTIADFDIWEGASAVLLPGQGQETSLEGFLNVIARLRAPDGCPWDRKQTHNSLRTYLLEETYEALDTLDRNDMKGLKEELGDLLLQIALHAQIALENGEFSMADIVRGINEKIVFRHPHVFKDWVAKDEKQVIQNWETLKEQERDTNGGKGLLDGVPNSYPALAQAQALQERAARVGFDWKEIAPVLVKIGEELEEIRKAQTEDERARETGDLLFALVNFIRWQKIDAESVLRQTNAKFRKRFAYIEKNAKSTGKQLQKMTLEEMDVLWEQAKNYDD